MKISSADKLRAPEDVLVSELDDEAVLLKLQSESYFGLDETGTRMWQALVSSDSVQQAYEVLLSEFDIDPHELRRHFDELLNALLQHGLVEVVA